MAGDAPAITVVTITRDNLDGLQRTFESLAAQDFKAFQHIVIDGASRDGSAEWARGHPVVPDAIVVSEPDAGIYDAMNKGANLATGRLVNFLNAGDTFAHPSVLSNVLRSEEGRGWAWGFGLARVVDAAGRPIRPVRASRYSFRRHALGMLSISHQAVFMRTSLFRELGGFDERYGLQADTHLLLRASQWRRPTTWNRVDVIYLAGGLSDRDVYASLYRKHLIRRSLASPALPPTSIDLVWTGAQIVSVAARKVVKRLLNASTKGGFTRWWAGRGL